MTARGRERNGRFEGMRHVIWSFFHVRTCDSHKSVSVPESEHDAFGKVTWDSSPISEFGGHESRPLHDGIARNPIELGILEMA